MSSRRGEFERELLGGRVRICVADALVPDSFVIAEARRIEILSPVSGG